MSRNAILSIESTTKTGLISSKSIQNIQIEIMNHVRSERAQLTIKPIIHQRAIRDVPP